ncbi:MAG: flagellar motor switch protein FliM, partial [Octadecabacter sp.]
MAAINPILAQKLGLTQAPPVAQDLQPATPMRQMRRSLARAADKAAGLSVSVLGISEEDLDAESLIEGGPEGWVVLGLRDGLSAGLTGLFL